MDCMDWLKPLLHQFKVLQILLSLAPWGVTSFIGNFGSFGSSSRKRWSTFAHGAFAYTSITQGFTFGELAKKWKKRWILTRCSKTNGLPNFLKLKLWYILHARSTWCTTRFVLWLKVKKNFKTLNWMIYKKMYEKGKP